MDIYLNVNVWMWHQGQPQKLCFQVCFQRLNFSSNAWRHITQELVMSRVQNSRQHRNLNLPSIMQMKTSEVKSCCMIGHMSTMVVVSLCISVPTGGHPEVIQKDLIPIYHWEIDCCHLRLIVKGHGGKELLGKFPLNMAWMEDFPCLIDNFAIHYNLTIGMSPDNFNSNLNSFLWILHSHVAQEHSSMN